MPDLDLPSMQRAIRTQPNGQLAIDIDAPLPSLDENMVLVKTVAVALNSYDHKMPAKFPSPGTVSGCDFAGTVVQVGPGVRRSWKAGDRVFGGIHGANPAEPTSGTFAEYLAADADFMFLIPEDMSWETAAAMSGIGIGTVGLALFYYLKPPGTLAKPAAKPVNVLVNGGATATGTMAIQLLKIAGLNPIATCSPKNFDLVKSYGAIHAFNYNDPNCVTDIKKLTKNSLKYVLDCIATAPAADLCYSTIGRLGGTYTALELPPLESPRTTIKTGWVLGMSLLGKEIALSDGYHQEANPEHRAFGVQYYRDVQLLINGGKLRAHPPKVMEGGMQGILDEGLALLKSQKVSGEKLVYFV